MKVESWDVKDQQVGTISRLNSGKWAAANTGAQFLGLKANVANWPTFRPHNSKDRIKNWERGRTSLWPAFLGGLVAFLAEILWKLYFRGIDFLAQLPIISIGLTGKFCQDLATQHKAMHQGRQLILFHIYASHSQCAMYKNCTCI